MAELSFLDCKFIFRSHCLSTLLQTLIIISPSGYLGRVWTLLFVRISDVDELDRILKSLKYFLAAMMEMYEYFILHGYTGLQYQTINREKGVNQVVINCVDTLP